MDIKKKLENIPNTPGVYFFIDEKGKALYIGKAGNLRKRVSSYFQKKYIDPRIERMISSIRDIDYMATSSSAEALIYESFLIKKEKPKYNIALKDDKSYPYLKLTVKEKYPRLFITREIKKDGSSYYGPYTNVKLLRQALSMMKRVFPLRVCNTLPKKPCLNYHIGQCPGPCVNKDIEMSYRVAVNDAKLFLSGKKKTLIKRLSERMDRFSKDQEYETALKIRDQLEALSVVVGESRLSLPMDKDLKELKDVLHLKSIPARIEAFDISNISGQDSVGSMITFFNAKPYKDGYRKYKIRTVGSIDDYAMIREVVRRRYRRLLEEKKNMPDLILIDGGRGHLNVALGELKSLGLKIPVISIAKKKEEIFTKDSESPLDISHRSKAFKLIQRIRDDAHRFAISYHKLLRRKTFFRK